MQNKSGTIKQRLSKNEPVFGTWCILPSPHTVNVMAKAGLDFVIIDMEHGLMDFRVAEEMVMAAQVEGCEAIIRPPRNGESEVLRALETGADGIIVPHISSVKDRKEFVSFAKYPPLGNRGFSPYTRAGAYHSTKDHTKIQNDKTLCAIIVEGAEGLRNIETICNDKSIDVVYIGTYDISCFLGIPGQVQDPKVVSILKESAAKLRKAGKVAGCMAHSIQEVEALKSMGITFILYDVDTDSLYKAYNNVVKNLR